MPDMISLVLINTHLYLNASMVIWNGGLYSTLRIRSMRRTYRNGSPQLAATIWREGEPPRVREREWDFYCNRCYYKYPSYRQISKERGRVSALDFDRMQCILWFCGRRRRLSV